MTAAKLNEYDLGRREALIECLDLITPIGYLTTWELRQKILYKIQQINELEATK